MSGEPQGSVLGPILFLIYINDLEEGVTSKILKFADDTKLFRKIKGNGDKQQLQDNIDKLIKWSEKWQMLFNFQKCKCLHAGHGNTVVDYEMGGTILCKTVKEKDLGVTMNANMKVSEQCRIAASKGNQILGMIRRGNCNSGFYTYVSDAHHSTSWLDHVICSSNMHSAIGGIYVVDKLPSSDHLPLVVTFSMKVVDKARVTSAHVNKGNEACQTTD